MRVTVRAHFVALLMTVCSTGCGASVMGPGQAGGSTSSAADELQALASGIDADVQAVLQPVDDAEALLAEIKSAKAQLGASFDVAFAAAANSPAPADPSVSAEVQAQLRPIAERASSLAAQLQSIPDRCSQLVSSLADRAARIPELAASATAEAQLTLNNPLASADDKAKAQGTMTLVSSLPGELTAKLKDAQARLTALPARAAASIDQIVTITGVSSATLIAAAPAQKPAGELGGAASNAAGPRSEQVQPYAALSAAAPWVFKGVAAGRSHLERSTAAIDALRDALMASVDERLSAAQLQAHAERISQRSRDAQVAAAALSRFTERASSLQRAIDELNSQLPQIASSAELWADHAIADFGADDAYKQNARKQKQSVTQLQVEALVAIQLAKNEMRDWPMRVVEAQTAARTLLAQAATSVPPAPGAPSGEATELPWFEPFPTVAGPPPIVEPQSVALSSPAAITKVDSTTTKSKLPLALAAALTVGALASAIYTVDRVAALNTCIAVPEGYGCLNRSTLDAHVTAGTAVTVTLSAGALGALIWALVD